MILKLIFFLIISIIFFITYNSTNTSNSPNKIEIATSNPFNTKSTRLFEGIDSNGNHYGPLKNVKNIDKIQINDTIKIGNYITAKIIDIFYNDRETGFNIDIIENIGNIENVEKDTKIYLIK